MGRYISEENFESRTIKLNPNQTVKHTHSLIWLHGRAESAFSYKDLFMDETLAIVPDSCRVVLPTAPTRPVTCNKGKLLTSWYDIITLHRPPTMPLSELLLLHNQEHIRTSVRSITALIADEVKSLNGDHTKVFIGGFS